jgi:hypothetical protein
MKMTFWDIAPCRAIMEAVHTSETSVYFENTRLYIPEVCYLDDIGARLVHSPRKSLTKLAQLTDVSVSARIAAKLLKFRYVK